MVSCVSVDMKFALLANGLLPTLAAGTTYERTGSK